MTGRLVDFHCHLDLYPDFEALVRDCDHSGIYTLAVTNTPRAWPRNRDLAARTKHVRAALGLHPQLVTEHWREIDAWESHLSETRYVGEVGLDAGPRFYKSLDRQKEVFRRVLKACANQGGKILSIHSVIHSVRAATPVLDMIERHLPSGRGTAVFHWFTGSLAEARRAVELGCFFSVNSRMMQSERGAKLVAALPDGHLLTETDGPFTRRGETPLRPHDVIDAVVAIAQCRGWSEEYCAAVMIQNLRTLTGTSA